MKADEEYRVEIQAILGKLIEEYREAILLDSKNSESEPLPSIISLDQTEEQQVSYIDLFIREKRNFYFI